ncbi:MAG: hypothetical protein KAI33_07190 [Elusimicrobiales bacterium]|nr:hypothetical protein [Elusimicrobiales bacterium]
MKIIKHMLFVSAVAVFCLALQSQKAFGQELLSYDSYLKTLMNVPGDIETDFIKPKKTDVSVFKFHEGEGQYLDFTIKKIFDGEYEVRQWGDIELRIKFRDSFSSSVKYEATGNIFGQEIDFMNPMIIEKDVFGSQQTLLVSGAGMDLNFEQRVGLNRMEVSSSNRELKPETIAVLMGLVDFLPNLKFSGGFSSYKEADIKSKSKTGDLSFRMSKRSYDVFYAEGDDINLRILSRKAGSVDTEYEITGSAFGMEFGFRDFIIRTDKLFLGTGGYRVQAPGINLEISRDNFASRNELKIKGHAGNSSEMILFLMSFSQYVLAN